LNVGKILKLSAKLVTAKLKYTDNQLAQHWQRLKVEQLYKAVFIFASMNNWYFRYS